jgi:hypothetical protein
MFSTLWIDQPGAEARAAQEVGSLGRALQAFVEDGYAIIPGAVDHMVIDTYLSEFETVSKTKSGMQSIHADCLAPTEETDLTVPLTKTLDTGFFCPSALDIMLAPKIVEFLKAIFEDDVLAHQNLHFEVGSTQAIHQDTAYVVVGTPMNLAACWVALEDIQESTGELIYYPGSHRFPHHLYGENRKYFAASQDRGEDHDRHLQSLHDMAAERGIVQKSFLPKKGDALIWHSDLAHGGGAILKKGVTRRSLVTHYCPRKEIPHYFHHVPFARLQPVGRNAVSSSYYDREVMVPPTKPADDTAIGRLSTHLRNRLRSLWR